MNKWEKLSSKTLLTHSRITVIEDTVRVREGVETDYIKFEGDYGASTLIVIRDDNKILVQKEYSYPPNELLFQFPGGGINKGESPKDAATRELSEEANIKGDLDNIGWFYLDNRRKDSKMYVFIAKDLSVCPGKLDIEEELEDYWLSEQEIDDMISNNELCVYSALASWAIYKNIKRKQGLAN